MQYLKKWQKFQGLIKVESSYEGGKGYMDSKAAQFTHRAFRDRLREMDYAIFDFDGTIYPRLFLYDLARRIFSEDSDEERYRDKLRDLNNIVGAYGYVNFKIVYSKFLDIIKGEDKAYFEKVTKDLMAGTYPYAKAVINKLQDRYNMRTYLISLTADFIAKTTKEKFGFDEVFSVGYLTTDNGRFNGKTATKIDSAKKMKIQLFKKLNAKVRNNEEFICFFDSEDDLYIADFARLRVGVNPSGELANSVDFDMILTGKQDPWKKFYSLV